MDFELDHEVDENTDIETLRTIEEKQIFILKRNWVLIDIIKQYRVRIPLISCSLFITMTGWILNSNNLPANLFQKFCIFVVIILLTLISLYVVKVIRRQYVYFDNKIAYLYRQLKMTGKDFVEVEDHPLEQACDLFRSIYVVICVVGFMCAIAILFSPIK